VNAIRWAVEWVQVLVLVVQMMELRDWLRLAYIVASAGVFTTMAWRRHGQ
jgi:hypothetical protein